MADGTITASSNWGFFRRYHGNYQTSVTTSNRIQPARPDRTISGISSWNGPGLEAYTSSETKLIGADVSYYTTYLGYTQRGSTYIHNFNNRVTWDEAVALVQFDISSISNTPVTINLKFTVANNVDASTTGSDGFYIMAPSAAEVTNIKKSTSGSSYFQNATKVKNSSSPKQTVAIAALASAGAKTIALTDAVIAGLKANGGYLYFTEAATTTNDPPQPKSFYAKTNIGVAASNVSIEYTITTSKCSAPTSITWAQGSLTNKTSGICKGASNAVTISWGGATGGTNNAISSYEIYYNAGTSPTTSSPKLTSTTTSVTIPAATINGLTRGTKYYVGVIAVGAAGQSYKSSMSIVTCYFQINKLPSAPTVNAPAYTTEAATSFIYSTTAGSDTDGQTYSVKYTIGNGTTYTDAGTSMSFPTTIAAGSSQTYHFWTYDGLEYSSTSKDVTVIRNKKISDLTATMSGLQPSAVSASGSIATQIKLECSYTAGTQSSSNYTYTWKLIKGTSSSAISTETSAVGATKTVNSYNVNGANITFGNYYKARIYINDGVETVNATTSGYFYIPAAPTAISAVYNQFADSDVSAANSAHFYQRLRVKFNNWNSSINYDVKLGLNNNFNSPVSSTSHIQSQSGTTTNGQVDATFSYNALSYNSQYKIKLVYSIGNISGELIYDTMKTTCANFTPIFGDIIPQGGSAGGNILPYRHNTFTVSISGQPMAFTQSNDMLTTMNSNYKWFIRYNNTDYEISINTSSGSSGIYTFTLNLPKTMTVGGIDYTTINALWKAILGLGSYPYSLYSNNIYIKCRVTNTFGAVFEETATLKADFRNAPQNLSLTAAYKNNSDGWTAISGTDENLLEGATLKFTGSFTTYNDTTPASVTFNSTKFTLGKSIDFTLASTTADNLITYTWTYSYQFVIPIIVVEGNSNFGLVVEAGGSFASSTSLCALGIFRRFVPNETDIAIQSVIETKTPDTNPQKYNYSFTLNGSTVGGNELNAIGKTYSQIAWKIQYKTEDDDSWIDFVNGVLTTGSITSITPSREIEGQISNAENIFFRLVLTYTKNTAQVKYAASPVTATQTYTWTQAAINAYHYYNSVPTLSYGKNNLYINTNVVPETRDQILIIRPTNNYKKILIGAVNEEAVIEIYNNDHSIKLDNFYIDGGSW